MKKYILLFTALLATSLTIFSQVNKPLFGIRAGITSSGVRGDAVSNFNDLLDFSNGMISTSNHTGFFGGGYISIPAGGVVSIEPALYYTKKGYDLKGNLNVKGMGFLDANAIAKMSMQYIDLPILVKANFKGFQVFAGPQISYLADASLKTSGDVLGLNLFNYKTGITNQLNRWDASLTGGAGYQLTNSVNIMASYDYGLSTNDANKNIRSYNKSLKVGVGFLF